MVSTPSWPDLLLSDRTRQPRVGPIVPGGERADRPAPIGLVAFRTHRGEPAEAILDASGTWGCAQLPILDRVLNALFAPGRADGGSGPFGHAELARVAAWIKGEARPADHPW